MAKTRIAARRGYTEIQSLEPGTPAPVAPHAAEWAVIVNHGMGQQLHFETIEQIVLALRDAQVQAGIPGNAPTARTRIVRLPGPTPGEQRLLRAELEMTDRDGAKHGVHIYESYWAPLTEGQVSLWDCLKFLASGLIHGIWFLIKERGFNRWAFGSMKEFPIRPFWTALKILFGTLLLLGPVILAVVVSVGQVLGSLLGVAGVQGVALAPGSTSAHLLDALTRDVAAFELCLIGFAIGARLLSRWSRWLALVLCFASLLALIVVEIVFVIHVIHLLPKPSLDVAMPVIAQGVKVLVWLGALALAMLFRSFLIQYVGDVAAYLSAHRLSKFNALRNAIRKSAFEVIAAVYRAKDQNGPLYRNVIMVGHSLGSVIAYDMLNQLLVEDELDLSAGQPGSDVQARTKLLLTFGSPLDKTAFLFRTKGDTDELREAAAANWQPLIREYAFRPDRWVNIYSWMDIISGNLRFYDDPTGNLGGQKRVENVYDRNAFLPLAAHTQYWTSGLVGARLYETVTR